MGNRTGLAAILVAVAALAGCGELGEVSGRLEQPQTVTRAQLEETAKDTSLQVVDVTNVPGKHASGGGFGGHGYWYANDWVLTDLLAVLRWQIRADQRGLVQKPGRARWYFPKDYPTRINAAVHELVAASAPTTRPASREADGRQP